jgi:predicted Zn-dependent protease
MSKRIRSLKILEQVAKMFGYSLTKQFADGGILKMLPNLNSNSMYKPTTTTTVTAPITRSADNVDRPNVSLTINSTQGYTPKQLATTAVSELSWQFLNR